MQATEIFNTADLARGMPRTGSLQLISGNTIAIIGNSYQAQSTTTYLDPHFVAPRVKGILDQFFDYRGRPLDDLTAAIRSATSCGSVRIGMRLCTTAIS